ncbi:protein of unknown function [Nitrosotalea devaniterrae]|uniref:Uncharacterized protein n=1 Tax=Nitrosotalea devaniterrae TaxID=1078905 RepID=A0A128A2Q5_9ARCH|nr:protein of unknown function [Candidatus Nitrosotalea devanaterra]
MSNFNNIDKETTNLAKRLWNLGAQHSINKENYSDYIEIWREISSRNEDFGATCLLKLAMLIDAYTSHESILSGIIEVRKGKRGIVEVTAVQQSERTDGQSIEVDLVAKKKKNHAYEVIVDSKTNERKPLEEIEIDGENCFFVNDDKGSNWLDQFL